MPERNIDIVRRLHQVFDETGMEAVRDALAEGRDPADMAADPVVGKLGELVVNHVDPDVEIHGHAATFSLPDMPVGTRFHGWDGWTEFWRAWLEPWEDWWFELTDLVAIGDHVVLDLEIRARGRESGIPIHVTASQVWTVRDERIVGLGIFDTRAEAIAAAESLSPGAR